MRAYIEELLPDILEGRINPDRVVDRNVGLDGVPDGYRAMADRENDENGSPVTWGEHVTDEQYAAAPSTTT